MKKQTNQSSGSYMIRIRGKYNQLINFVYGLKYSRMEKINFVEDSL